MKMILWQCCNKSCRYWKYFTVCFASSYLFVVISTALSYIWTWLVCRLNLVNAVNAESSWCAHTHARTMKTQFVPTAVRFTQYSYLITWASPCLCSESDSVCVYEARLAHLLFQLFVIWIVIPRMSSCMPLQSTACVCVKGCDKRACMLGIKVVSVLQCWLADLLLRKKWLRSKQELEPSRSVCVSVCFLFPADPSARSLLSLAWWSTFHS